MILGTVTLVWSLKVYTFWDYLEIFNGIIYV